MSIPMLPFVNRKRNIVNNIGSTPTLILGSQYVCDIEEILIVNLFELSIKVFSYVLWEDQSQPQESIAFNGNLVEALETKDLLERKFLRLYPGDLLYSYSDFSGNLFNCFVFYKEYTELGGI